MFKISIDVLIDSVDFNCPLCGACMRYFEEHVSPTYCTECSRKILPSVSSIKDNKLYRVGYHKGMLKS